jgi:hypothetical protein
MRTFKQPIEDHLQPFPDDRRPGRKIRRATIIVSRLLCAARTQEKALGMDNEALIGKAETLSTLAFPCTQ